MNASELAAAAIVAAYLEGRQEPRDVETAPDGTHDFDVVLKDRQRVALEVTAAADHKRIAFDDGPSARNGWHRSSSMTGGLCCHGRWWDLQPGSIAS